MRTIACLAAVLTALAGAAEAQTWTPPFGAGEQSRRQLDLHRLEMERLRLRADQRELEARQSALESRLSVMRVEAARQPEPVLSTPSPRSNAVATRQRETVQGGVEQIDAWLDRCAN